MIYFFDIHGNPIVVNPEKLISISVDASNSVVLSLEGNETHVLSDSIEDVMDLFFSRECEHCSECSKEDGENKPD